MGDRAAAGIWLRNAMFREAGSCRSDGRSECAADARCRCPLRRCTPGAGCCRDETVTEKELRVVFLLGFYALMPAFLTTTFSHQNFTNEQILDAGRRLVAAVLDPQNGVPAGDAVTRDIVADAASDLDVIEIRLGLERKKGWTEEKRAAEKERDQCLSALRRGAREIQRDPDPAVTAAARAGGTLIQGLFAKRPAGFEKKTSAENSGGLRLFFKDFEADAPQAALRETGLIRYYTLLQQAQAKYERLIAEIEAQEAAAAAQPRLPILRDAKQDLAEHIRLTLQIVAHFAAKGVAPYDRVAARCGAILEEVTVIARSRETRASKAEAKEGILA